MDILLQTIISEISIKAPRDPKNGGVMGIFPNFDFILNRENQHHGFIFA